MNKAKLPALFVVPHKSIHLVENELHMLFESLKCYCPDHIFIFGKLHNGPVGFDDDFTIFTDSNCPIENSILTKNDDVCTEEFGAEILFPFIDKYFHGIQANQFLTPEKNARNAEFFNSVCKQYRNSLIFISRNEQEDSVWPESLQG